MKKSFLICATVIFLLFTSTTKQKLSASESDVVAALSVSSINAYAQVAKEWGASPPYWLTKNGLESMFRFSQSGIQSNRPLGLYVVAGAAPRQRILVGLPVGREVAMLHKMKQWGAKPVPGDNYAVLWGGTYLKRTPNYIFGGGTASSIKGMSETSLVRQHRSTAQVIRGMADIKRMHKIDPKSIRQFTGMIKLAGLAGGQVGQQMSGTLNDMIEKQLTFIDFSVDRTGSNYDVNMNLYGLERWKVSGYSKPLFPGHMIARMDMVYGTQKNATFFKSILPDLYFLLTKQERPDQAYQSFIEKLTNLLMEGEAISFAFHQTKEGMPVLYGVGQRGQTGDLTVSLDKLLQDSANLRRMGSFIEMDNGYVAKADTRTGKETVVFQMHTLDRKGQPTLYVELAEHEKYILFAMSPAAGNMMNEILPLKSTGRLVPGVDVEIYMDRLVEAAPKWGAGVDPNATKMSRSSHQVLAGKLRGQRVKLSAKFTSKYLQLKAKLPVKILVNKDAIASMVSMVK